MFPDYMRCPVNLACSILKEFGAPYTHPTLACVDELLKRPYKNVVVLLLDGMGMDTLAHHLAPDGLFRTNLVVEITSVFPSTTVASTTSIESGLTPAEHGWLGWSLYFEEIDKIVEVFPNIEKSTKLPAADYNVAQRYIPYKSIYEKINEAGVGRARGFYQHNFKDEYPIDAFLSAIAQECAKEGRRYVYAHWDEPDGLMHHRGAYSPPVRTCMAELEEKIGAFAAALSDTLLLVTADHGHLDVDYDIVSEHPELASMFERPFSIEARAAAFHVKEEFRDAFPAAFRAAFGDNYVLYTRDEVKRLALFGNGVPHPKFDSFAGDFIAVAVADRALAPDAKSRRFLSTHAGLNEKEMRIPVIALSRP